MSAKPGEKLKLKYTVTDPDKDALTIKWWQYVSAGTYRGKVTVDDPASANTALLFRLMPTPVIPST